MHSAGKSRGTFVVSASQIHLEPLERLKKLLGGNIYIHTNKRENRSKCWQWRISGHKEAWEAYCMLWDYLCDPKRQQILGVIAKVHAYRVEHPPKKKGPKVKSHCIHGHEFSEENTYWWNGKKFCKICRSGASKRSQGRR